ncbi:MAG TPA: adenosylcobinamide-GDP ribazoletransferase [Thermoleophilia bacterium]|nr:adenosylcobinamide-GDP ribazoletransferase [Thermoleophilia bacterium]
MTDTEDKRVEKATADAAADAPPMKITMMSSTRGADAEAAAQGPSKGSSARSSAAGSSASTSAASRSASPGSVSRRFTLAVTFLTGIPLKVEGEVSPADLWGSMGWYPLVGLAMGFAAWVVYAGMASFLPGLVASALVVILLELLTRGLHLDGLMDTADGVLSGAPRERALEIMKDHNVGAMGVAAAVLLLVLKVAALGALARADAAAPLIAGLCAARALPALDVYAWPYARPAGTGEAFTREHTPQPLQLAGALLVAGIVVAGLASLVTGATGSWYGGVVVAAVAMGVALGVQALVARKLGGLTGDVYGMGIELAEAAALVAGCAIVGLAR